MDARITEVFDKMLDNGLLGIVISNSADKEQVSKIKIRPVVIKEELYYQASEYKGNKVYHNNYSKELLIDKLPDWFDGLFKQAEIKTKSGQATLLISKKGRVTVNYKPAAEVSDNADDKSSSVNLGEDSLLHNRPKNYILSEGIPLPFLIDLGVMTADGTIIKAKMDKFRQINRFLEYIEDILPNLDKGRELTIIDFGCGKSYLTFAMYYYLKLKNGYNINVIGLDLKSDVIKHCNELSRKYGYDKLNFLQGDIASYDGTDKVDMVVTLHACDTATDHALYKAVSWGAKVILSVPCCQHELNSQINCEILKPVLKYGIIKERMSALFTDAFRADLLETAGYRVQLLEFIDMEHTPKNILIRAVKRNEVPASAELSFKKLKDCMDFIGVSPSLYKLLQSENAEEGQ